MPHPEQRPVDFYKPDFDVSGWKEIPVPSNWQVLGYGTPYYRNNGYIFQKDWPHVMSEPPKNYTAYDERNPVGSYRREFEVPADVERAAASFLTFDGVDSAFFLWINGQKVGYSVNSRNAAEFDITAVRQARARTWSPSRSIASAPAATWKTRTCGASAASSATSPSGARRRSTYAISSSRPTSTRSTAMPRSK